jgi:MoaA/NifB/PqqE/SkfB family radical SAM enzyme
MVQEKTFDRINIEIINTCNLKCSFCPTPEKPTAKMTVEQFSGLATTLASMTKEVVLHLLGEPLSHPDLAGILSAAQSVQLPVNIVTNGLLLTGERVDLVLGLGVRQLSISLQSFTNNFPDQDPSSYVRRIKVFVDRALAQRPDLYINLRFWDLDGNSAEETNHNHNLRTILAKVFEFNWEDVHVDVRRRKNYRLTGRLYLHFDSRFVWPNLDNEIQQTEGFCHGLTGHFGIHADGTVVPCCLDHKADIPLGNVFSQPVVEILKSPRAAAMRAGFARGQLVEDLCRRCGFISRFALGKKNTMLNSKEVITNGSSPVIP